MKYRSPLLLALALSVSAVVVPALNTPTAFAANANVAVGATAAQSSTYDSASASRAVDGNTNGSYPSNSVSHTDSQAQAWWALDLRSSFTLTDVVVWNRTDCCASRLSDFYVLVSDNPIASTDLATARAQAGVSSYHVSASPSPSVSVPVNRTGRYLRVQLAGTNYLSIAEVQVFSSSATLRDYAKGGRATQSSTYPTGLATRAIDGDTNGVYTANSVSHTNSQAQAWWALDLRSSVALTNVVVWNRTDGYTTRLSDFYVLVSDNPIASTDLATARAQAGVSSYHVSASPSPSVSVPVNRSGRYLRVQLAGTNYLSLAEVQAFGTAALLKPDAQGWVTGNKFGMFLHYGMGTMTNAQWADPATPASTFNPPGTIDTAQWAAAMKSAGMTFGVLTAKHHDGFALWPTASNAYDVASSPWKNGGGDLVAEYVASLRAAGLKVGIYFSIWDRHNGDNVELIKNQLRELLTDYGQIDYLWFDGWGWKIPYTTVPYQTVRDFISNVSPKTVVANNDHKSTLTTTDVMVWEVPVQGFPPNNSVPKDASDTLDANNTWFYTTSTGTPKAASTIVGDLDSVNAGNALYLLNVGPDKSGVIPQAYRDRLTEIGNLR